MATIASAQANVLRSLLEAVVTGDGDRMADLVTADVLGWSPHLAIASREDLLAAMGGRDDDSFSGIDLQIRAIDQIGDKAIAEWHVAADHTGPLVVDDDVVIAPTGRRVHLSGATVAEFDGELVCAFRSYFDDLAIVEQALADG
jgi:ketosteroid isomerase-like protein